MPVLPKDVSTLHDMRFPSRRSAVLSRNGMVATSQPLAAQAGLAALRSGGNAVDAAVTAAAVLAVTEPTGCGLGGDAFALIFRAGDLSVRAFDGSGCYPSGADRARIESLGHASMPTRGALTVTVPGVVDAWHRILDAEGTFPLGDCLQEAIRLAEEGFPVSELISAAWQRSEDLLENDAGGRRHYLPDGRAPTAGRTVRLPALGRTLRRIATGGRDAFYRGAIAGGIEETVTAAGGFLTQADLAHHRGRWVDPISTTFEGIDVWQCPPPGQGLAALLALAIARAATSVERPHPWASPAALHTEIEAMRLAFTDARAVVADPDHAEIPVAHLLSDRHASTRAALIDPARAVESIPRDIPPSGDTVYLATLDRFGNGCSLIQSNYMGFGSGLVTPDSGIALQNRGAGFTMDEGHPNVVAPGKRPFHTIIPGMATRSVDGSLYAVFGVMGGHMQPQGHLQVLINMRRHGMDPQRALDAPRFQITPSGTLALEPWFPNAVRKSLRERGHTVVPRSSTPSSGSFGGGQIIALSREGVRVGGSDPRKDGLVAAW